jgi:hypothetical protein
MNWQQQFIQRLRHSAHSDGGWPYQPLCAPSAEPTALTCLALAGHDDGQEAVQKGLQWLADRQQHDGGVAVNAIENQPCWSTALAYLAWNRTWDSDEVVFSEERNHAAKWLLQSEGKPFKSYPALYGHDTRLKGWSWVEGTHSWVEPTAYAILALREAGHGDHPRTREAVSLLLDRTMSQGGWNYGNNRMFGSDLRPFPAQTGMVLAALAGEPRHDCIDKAIQFLHSELPRVRTPVSLGWGLIGAAAWQARPDSAESWLAECAERLSRKPHQPLFDAMLLLADAQPCPLLRARKESARET